MEAFYRPPCTLSNQMFRGDWGPPGDRSFRGPAVAAGRGGRMGYAPRAALYRGGIWREFGNSASGKLAFALQNGFGGFVSRLQ